MFDPNKMNSFLGKTQCVWLYMIPCDDSMMTFFKLRTLFQVESSRRNPRRGRTHRAGVISMPFFDWQWCRSWKHEDQLLTLVKHFLTEFYFRLYNHNICSYIYTYKWYHPDLILIHINHGLQAGRRTGVLGAAWPTWRFQNDVRSTKSASVATFQGFKSCLLSCLNSWIKLF